MGLTKSEQQILKYLIRHVGESLYENEIAKNIPISIDSANQSLKFLLKKDMVTLEKKGNMNFYILNLDNPLVRQYKITQTIAELNGLLNKLKPLTKRIILLYERIQKSIVLGSIIDMDKWMTLEETAEYLQVSKDSIFRLVQKSKIPVSKVGNLWRFKKEEIDEWLKDRRNFLRIKMFKFIYTKKNRNFLFVAVYLIGIFCAIEVIFRHISISHGVGYTLASELWFKKYWWPVNQFGFRDYNIDTSIADKKKIFVLGDSFVAGHGIKFVENRFSNIISKKLFNQFQIINMGRNGVDTLQEKHMLNSFPYKPDILILVYSPNDIGDRAAANGIVFRGFTPYDNLNPIAKFIISKSYFLNFLYWQFPHNDLEDYVNFLKTAYANKAILNTHLNDLEYFVNYSKEHSISLYVIIFPFFAPILDQGYLDVITDFFNSRDIETISVSALTVDIPLNKLIVSRMDIHPNEFANKIVADELLKRLRENDHIF